MPHSEPKEIIPTDLKDLVTAFDEMAKKYMVLVWYARSQPRSQMVVDGVSEDHINIILDGKARLQEMYPDEIDDLKSESGDWSHGFNSGCLAAFRYVITAMAQYEFPDEESDDPEATFTMGGLKEAEDEFPCLDT
jgi:hypothetical protein